MNKKKSIFLHQVANLEDSSDSSDEEFDNYSNVAVCNKNVKLTELDVIEKQLPNMTFIIHNHASINVPKWTEKVFKSIKMWNLFKTNHDTLPESGKCGKIEIFNFQVALETLRLFGGLMTKLQLNFSNADSNEAKTISKYVNEYCAKSVIEIKLDIKHGNTLKYWTIPFENVERLSFGVKPLSNRPNMPQLNEIFPKLQTISLYLGTKMRSYFRCHFRYLEELIINEKGSNANDSYIENLLKENPQIRNVSVYKGRPTLLRKLNVELPLLDSLTIKSFKDFSDDVHFKRLTKLQLKESLEVPTHLHAPYLRELEMAFSSEHLNGWRQFLKTHNNLTRFHLNYYFIYHDEFTQLTDYLPNLQEMTVSRYQNAYSGMNWTFPAVDTIVKFLDSHKQLQKFDIDLCTDTDKQILQQKLQQRWYIIEHSDGISFRLNETQN